MQHLETEQTTAERDLQVALVRNDIAHQSVQALLDDLEFVMIEVPLQQQAEAAAAVLAHHEPPVDEALLSNEGRQLQRSARWTLQDLAHLPEPRQLPTPGSNHQASTVANPPLGGVHTRATRVRRGLIIAGSTAALSFGIGSLIQQVL